MLLQLIENSLLLYREYDTKATLLLLILVGVYVFILVPFFISPLRHVPGPYLNRVSSFNALNKQRTFKWIKTVHDWHKKYGNIVILSPHEISVDGDSRYVHDIYVKNFPKGTFYDNFRNHGFKDNIFSSSENRKHLGYKKIIMNLYSKSAVFSKENSIRGIMVEKTKFLMDEIYNSSVIAKFPDILNAKSELNEYGKGHHSKNGEWFNPTGKSKNIGMDVYSLFASLAMDVISAVELGKVNGTDFLRRRQDRYMIIKHRIQAGMVFWTTLMPRFWDWAASEETKQASREVEQWQLSLYAQAEKNVPVPKEGENISTLETLKKSGITGKNAYSFISDNIFAGHETTAIQLAYLTYELSRPLNFEKQRLLKNELVDHFGKPRTNDDLIDDFETVDNLPYLSALLEENLRVHASIPGAEPRVVDRPYNVVLNNGKDVSIPQGTIISCQVYSIGRQKHVFPDPYRFIPERWLKYDKESEAEFIDRISRQRRYMMPFGKGIRMCLGMNIAVTEMKLAVANMYWHYSSKLCTDWCKITEYPASEKIPRPIEIGLNDCSKYVTDEEMMSMNDAYTTRPALDECWLEWYENK